MHDLVIIPRDSVGPFKLGSSRDEVRAAAAAAGITQSSERDHMDYFLQNAVQVEYSDGAAHFIGVSPGMDGYRVLYRGVDLSDISAAELFELAAEADGSGPHVFNEYEYCFPNQILTLWEADDQYDRVRRRTGEPRRVMWAQVGVGTPKYVEAIERINAQT